ncbi:phosphatase PAP2 family protein [Streptomyces sp. NPDC047085]|uniref:phosphatase PAP2 family protein n=1 Tax=Streptomyces sp. NPDC047085 TaxID=3155140 RepID=UPI0033F6E485
MRLLAGLRDADRSLSKQAASRIPPRAGKVLSAVEEAAASGKLWCGAAAAMTWLGGWRGRTTAVTGMAALAVAQLISNGLCKQPADRPRPPKEWFPHDEADDRPSSFPSGHTAAAVAFTATVAATGPAAGAACALPAVMVALERVQSGAHYPTDVAAGAAIGLASAWLTRHAPVWSFATSSSGRDRPGATGETYGAPNDDVTKRLAAQAQGRGDGT